MSIPCIRAFLQTSAKFFKDAIHSFTPLAKRWVLSVGQNKVAGVVIGASFALVSAVFGYLIYCCAKLKKEKVKLEKDLSDEQAKVAQKIKLIDDIKNVLQPKRKFSIRESLIIEQIRAKDQNIAHMNERVKTLKADLAQAKIKDGERDLLLKLQVSQQFKKLAKKMARKTKGMEYLPACPNSCLQIGSAYSLCPKKSAIESNATVDYIHGNYMTLGNLNLCACQYPSHHLLEKYWRLFTKEAAIIVDISDARLAQDHSYYPKNVNEQLSIELPGQLHAQLTIGCTRKEKIEGLELDMESCYLSRYLVVEPKLSLNQPLYRLHISNWEDLQTSNIDHIQAIIQKIQEHLTEDQKHKKIFIHGGKNSDSSGTLAIALALDSLIPNRQVLAYRTFIESMKSHVISQAQLSEYKRLAGVLRNLIFKHSFKEINHTKKCQMLFDTLKEILDQQEAHYQTILNQFKEQIEGNIKEDEVLLKNGEANQLATEVNSQREKRWQQFLQEIKPWIKDKKSNEYQAFEMQIANLKQGIEPEAGTLLLNIENMLSSQIEYQKDNYSSLINRFSLLMQVEELRATTSVEEKIEKQKQSREKNRSEQWYDFHAQLLALITPTTLKSSGYQEFSKILEKLKEPTPMEKCLEVLTEIRTLLSEQSLQIFEDKLKAFIKEEKLAKEEQLGENIEKLILKGSEHRGPQFIEGDEQLMFLWRFGLKRLGDLKVFLEKEDLAC